MTTPAPYLLKRLFLTFAFFAAFDCAAAEARDVEPLKVGKSQLIIRPSVVAANDVIIISLPKKHPQKMSIKSPNGEWFVVHEKSEKVYFFPKHKSSSATSVRKKVAKIRGVKWVDGKRMVEPVFNEPGEYLFYMADNLETEPENTFSMMGAVIYRK